MTNIKTLICAAAMSLALPQGIAQTDQARTEKTKSETLTVNVKGMVCDFCARAVSKVFGKNDAVDLVHVDLDNGEIHVDLKPGTNLTDEEIESLVKKSGYAMVSVEREIS